MKLKSVLKDLPPEALQVIQEYWSLPPLPESADRGDVETWVEHLYPRLQNGANFKETFEKLDPFQRNLVNFLAIHGGNMEEKELQKRCFTGKRNEMKDVLAELKRVGFVFHERWVDVDGKPHVFGIPEPFLRFLELPHFWQGHLGALLREMAIEELIQLATRGLGLKLVSQKKDRLVYAVRSYLTEPETLRQYIDSLPEDEREVFFLVLQRRGVCLHRDLIDTIQGRRPDLARGNPIGRLTETSGLLFQVTHNVAKYQNLLRIPRDLHHIITNHFVRDIRGIDDLDAISRVSPDSQPKVILDSGTSILRDLVIFAGSVDRAAMRRLGNGGIGKNDLKKILPRLSANKGIKYAQFLATYCIDRQILVPTGDHWSVSDGFEEMLEDSRAFYLDLYRFWLEASDWNEEFVEGDCLHTDNRPTNLVNIVELRRLVLRHLARIPFETWVDGARFIESLLSQIELHLPNRGAHRRVEKYNRINYLVIESILCESLYWLGLIALGLQDRASLDHLGKRPFVEHGENGAAAGRIEKNGDALTDSRNDTAPGTALADRPGRARTGNSESVGQAVSARLDRHFNYNPRPHLPDLFRFHFQINGLGRSILASQDDTRDELFNGKASIALPFRDDMVQFTVLPNLDVVAPPDLNLAHFRKLQQFTEIRHIDVMSILTITQDSLRAGMDRGMKGEDILRFLQDGCPSGLPETVRHLISECRNRYGEISIGHAGGYILVDDPVLLEDLRNNKTLVEHIKDILAERVIILSHSADVQQVARELQRLGFMPTIDSQNVYASSEGRLRFTLTPEDLGALMGILRFVLHVEEEMGVSLTDEKARPLLQSLLPAGQSQFNLNRYAESTGRNFEKRFETALKKKVDGVAERYRRQLKDLLAHQSSVHERSSFDGPNPATRLRDIRKLLDYAIEEETPVEIRYARSTNEEIAETVRPESLDNEKLYAFCEDRQADCAYRLKRIRSVRI